MSRMRQRHSTRGSRIRAYALFQVFGQEIRVSAHERSTFACIQAFAKLLRDDWQMLVLWSLCRHASVRTGGLTKHVRAQSLSSAVFRAKSYREAASAEVPGFQKRLWLEVRTL